LALTTGSEEAGFGLVPELLLQLIHPLVRVEMPPPASFTVKPANQKRQFTYFFIEKCCRYILSG
jgi:hypothetical protein